MQHVNQSGVVTVAERLGYDRNAKLLIVHADDLGMTHSVNKASTRGFETGLVSSGSIMVPCPWFPEIARYAQTHPDIDLGLHLTLTSESSSYRWGPVCSREQVPSLVDAEGYFYPAISDLLAHARASEVETEIRGQIERAYAFGIRPTHFDSHMYALYSSRALLEVLLNASRNYNVPMMTARQWLAPDSLLASALTPNDIVIDRLVSVRPGLQPERWDEFYTNMIMKLEPGLTQLLVHLSYDDEEMRSAMDYRADWGAGWRQRDFDFFTSDKFRRLIEENNIELVTYRQLQGQRTTGT